MLLQGVFGNFTFSQEGRDVMQDYLRGGRWIKLLRHANSLRNHGRHFVQSVNALRRERLAALVDQAAGCARRSTRCTSITPRYTLIWHASTMC